MHKSVGPVERFERFLTHAKLYRRAANTARPYPLPPTPTPPTVLKPSKHNSFDLSTLYWMGNGEVTWICKMTPLLFTTLLVIHIELQLCSDCPKDFSP